MKKIFIAIIAMVSLQGYALAATLNVVSNTTDQSYYNTVTKTADRLVALQNTNGGWDWDVTGQTGPTSNTYLNVTGVTAEDLLSAYKITGNAVYLDAAKKAGDFIISEIDASSPKKINGYNVLFLQELSTVSGVSSYATKAAEYFGVIYSSTPTTLCASGCADSTGLYNAYVAYRSGIGVNNGVVAWDLVAFVEYATFVNDSTHASEIEALMVSNLTDSGYVSGVANYDLGLASGLKAATLVGDTASATTFSAALSTTDGSFGTASDGKVQTTAYVLKALKKSGDGRSAATAQYLAQAFNGSMSGWTESDGVEYGEVDSEAASAVATMLPEEVRYYAIQAAVNAAQAGDTVLIHAGTYAEQVTLDKNLTVTGDNKTTTIIQAPSVLVAGTAGQTSIVEVKNGATVTVSGVQVAGPGSSACGSLHNGIFVIGTSTLNLSNSAVTDVRDSSLSGCQNGRAIRVGLSANNETGTATINNNTITGYQKSGIFVDGTGSSATITNNTITGVGSTPLIAQNGITLYNGATGTITGNTISGNVYTGNNSSVGILLYNQGAGVEVKNNTSTGNQIGVSVVGTTTATVKNNNLGGNSELGLDTEVALDASPNFWGSASDPTTTNALATSTLATYSPWYTSAAMTGLSSTVSTTSTATSITLNTQTTTSTSTSAGSIAVDIPAGTKITGPATWDGTFTLPTIVSSPAVPTVQDGAALTVLDAIELGAGDTPLTFDQPTKITFAGQVGKSVGWLRNGVFTKISTACDLPVNPTLEAGADCKINVGSDLVVWTKHATTFVAVTETPVTVVPSVSGGGGSASSGSSSGSGAPTVSVTPTQTPAVTPSQVAVTPVVTTQTGEVLGASTYGFTRNLSHGATGDDVTELQKVLMTEGFLKIKVATKWFGPLTKAALIKWQAKHGLPATGYFGAMSRAELLK